MDHRRIDRYMENHFTDEVGDMVCQLFVDGDTTYEGPRKEWDLQYLEQRVLLQEDLIDTIADEYEMVNHSLAYQLTEMCKVVDDYIYDCYGDTFISPTGKDMDTAEYIFHMEPEIYYDIAQNIIASHMDRIVEMLENGEEVHFDYCCYKMVKKESNDDE